MTGPRKAELNAMVEEATIDCHDEEEQLTGLASMVEENLEVPFATTSLIETDDHLIISRSPTTSRVT